MSEVCQRNLVVATKVRVNRIRELLVLLRVLLDALVDDFAHLIDGETMIPLDEFFCAAGHAGCVEFVITVERTVLAVFSALVLQGLTPVFTLHEEDGLGFASHA